MTTHYPHTFQATLSAKQGDTQTLNVGVRHYTSCPSLDNWRQWRDMEGLKGTELAQYYCGQLLGTPVYRGLPLLNISFEVKKQWQGELAVYWRQAPTDGARKWLAASLDAKILGEIDGARAVLHAAALAYVRQRFAEGVRDLRRDADAREREAAEILARLAPK